jgi:hypothetical protein
MDAIAREVGQQYAEIRTADRWQALGSAGGFSGSLLWRIESTFGVYCLRAWPSARTAKDVEPIHRWMQRACTAGLSFVPQVIETASKSTCVESAGRRWELTTWQHGKADFHRQPSAARLQAALTALAQLHGVWQPVQTTLAASEAVARRHAILSAWQRSPAALAANPAAASPQLAHRAIKQLSRWITPARLAVEPWIERRLPLQPCLCDIWHDHILFDGDHVTGIVDYGNMRSAECVAADLGRLLGSLLADDWPMWEIGLAAYADLHPLGAAEKELARQLDWTGIVVAVGHWLEWLGNNRLSADYLPAATRRLEQLVTRMEDWNENTRGHAPVGIGLY